MPCTSPYRIVLTEDERRHLEAAARRYTSPYREVVRARIVLYADPIIVRGVLSGHTKRSRNASDHGQPEGGGIGLKLHRDAGHINAISPADFRAGSST